MTKNIQNLSSNPETQKQVNQRKEPVRGEWKHSQKLWRVVKVALGIPIFGKSLKGFTSVEVKLDGLG